MADGKISIDLVLNNLANGTLRDFVANAKIEGESAYRNMSDPFKKAIIAELDTDAKTAGIKNFGDMLAELPKNKQTKLIAEAKLDEAKRFKVVLDGIPKERLIEVAAKAKDVELKNFKQQIKDLPKEEQTQLVAKYEKSQVTAYEHLLNEVPEEKRTELQSKFDKDGVIDFKELIESVPDEKKTEVIAKAQKRQAEEFEKLIQDIPEEKRSEIYAKAHDSEAKAFESVIAGIPKGKQTALKATVDDLKAKDYEHLLRKIPARILTKAEVNDNASPKLKNLQHEAIQTEGKFHRLRDVMIGSFAGNIITSGVFALTGGLKDAAKAGMAYDKVQDTMRTNWKALTTEAPKDGKAMVGFINDLSQHSIYSADSIDKMAQSFYHIKSSAPDAKKWSQDFVNLGSTLHVSNDALAESGQQFAKIVAGGKASQEDMNVMINRFPMFGEALEKASGKSMKQLQEMSAKGKLTAKQFTDALDYLGKKYRGSQAEALNSAQGMGMYLHSRLEKISGDVMKSSFNMSKSTLDAIKRITSDKSMEMYSKGISSAIGSMTTGFAHLIEYVAKNRDSIISIVGSIKDIAGAFIGGAWTVAKGTLTTIFNILGRISGNAKSASDPLKNIAGNLSEIAKHKGAIEALGGAFMTAFAAKKMIDFGSSVMTTVSTMKKLSDTLKITTAAQWLLNAATEANPYVLIISAVVAFIAILGVAGVALYKHNKQFREFVDGLVKGASDVAKNIGKFFGQAFNAIGKFISGTLKLFKSDWKEIALFIVNPISGSFALLYKHNDTFKKFINGLVKSVQDAFKGIGSWFGKQGSGIGKWFSNLEKDFSKGWNSFTKFMKGLLKGFGKLVIIAMALPLGVAMTIFEPLFKGLSKVLASMSKALSAFGKSISKVWSSIWNPVAKLTQSIFKKVEKTIESTLNTVERGMSVFGKVISKVWHNIWNPIHSFLSGIIKSIRKNLDAFFDWGTKNFNSFGKSVRKIWDNTWDKIRDFFDDIVKSIKKIAGKAWDWMTDRLNSFSKVITKLWHSLWTPVKNFFDDIWDDIKKIGSKAWNWIENKLDDFSDNVTKGWKSTWRGLRNFFDDIWDDIKGLAKDGMNGVIGMINKGIGGINGVIHDFGGSKQAISPIRKFAHGTGGAPAGLAMVNDGFDSPTGQEMILDNAGKATILEGRNRLVNFQGGETVVPASMTQALMNNMPHFADGTSNWFGGVKDFFGDLGDDFKDAFKEATGKAKAFLTMAKNPLGYAENTLLKPVVSGLQGLKGSAIQNIGGTFNNSNKGVSGQQGKWWHELWNMLKDAMSGGDSSGGGKGNDYRFNNKGKDSGVDPYGYFFHECVSFVANRLANEGVKSSLFSHLGNGSEWTSAKVPHSKTPKVGDVAVYSGGSKYGNHVSIVTGVHGGKFDEEGMNAGNPPNGKYYKSRGLKFSDATTFLNFGKSSGGSDKSDDKKSNNPLQKLIRKEVGGIFDWVSDTIGGLIGSFEGPSGQGTMSRNEFNRTAHRAASMIGEHLSGSDLARLWSQAMFESNVNPGIKTGFNDHDGTGTPKGLFQYKTSTFDSYAYKGHRNILSALDQFLAVFNDRNWRSDLAPTGIKRGWGPSGATKYANGGWGGNELGIFNEVPGEEEIVVNPNRDTADKHIQEVIDKRAQLAPDSKTAKLKQVIDFAKAGQHVNSVSMTQNIAKRPQAKANVKNDNAIDSGDLVVEVNLDSVQIGRKVEPVVNALNSKRTVVEAHANGLGGNLNYGGV